MILFSFLLIILISLLVLKQTFTLALFGDDWLAFWRYLEVLGPNATQGYNHLSYFLTLYGPQDILMGGILRPVFGFNSSLYYLTSYIFRLLAAFSLFPLLFHLTKSKLASFFGCLFFSISVIGFDTTNWVFNMPSYLSVACFNLYLFFLLKIQEGKKFFLLTGLFLYLAFILAPIRMTGAIPITLVILLFLLIFRKLPIKKFLLISGVVLGVFFFAAFIGESFGPVFYSTGNFSQGFSKVSELISQNRADFILNPLVIFGGLLLPDLIIPNYGNVLRRLELILNILLPSLVIFSLLIFTIKKNASGLNWRFTIINFTAALILNLLLLLYYPYYIGHFGGLRQIAYLLTSGYCLILFGSLILYVRNLYLKLALLLGISIPVISYLYPWWRVPDLIFETTHRYLIVAAAGMSVLFASFIALGKTLKNKVILSLAVTIFLLLNYLSVNQYLYHLNQSHGQELSNKIWSQIPYYPEIKNEQGPFLFYFVGDGTNGNTVHNIITFGLPPNMSLRYNIQLYSVLPMDSYEEMVTAVKTGESLKRHGQVVKPVPLDRIYSFKLEGKDKLINQTQLLREKISRDLKEHSP